MKYSKKLRFFILTATIALTAVSFTGCAEKQLAADQVEVKTVVTVGQSIELADGGKLLIEQGGVMIHTDAAGNRIQIAMKDGETMEAKDGTLLIMKNKVLYRAKSNPIHR